MKISNKILRLFLTIITKIFFVGILIIWLLFPNHKLLLFIVRLYLFSVLINLLYMKIQFQTIYLLHKNLDDPFRTLQYYANSDEITFIFPGIHIPKYSLADIRGIDFISNNSVYQINYSSSVDFCSESNIIKNTIAICNSIISKQNKKITKINLVGRSFGTGLVFPVVLALQKKNINIDNILLITPFTSLRDVIYHQINIFVYIKLLIGSWIHGNYYDITHYTSDINYNSINKITIRNALNDTIIPFDLQLTISEYLKSIGIATDVIINNISSDHYIGFF